MRTPSKVTVATPADLLGLVGQELGISQTQVVTQEEVNLFADVTKDHQWIHVDVERAEDGPFGSTIVHGFLTLALVPRLLADILEVETFSMGVNYGLDRVRFIKPLPPGTRIQGVATLVAAQPLTAADGNTVEGVQAKASVAVEFADEPQTCCVAEILFRYYA
ncbi:MaoC family dehydratase [Nocardioides nitrophenolicus]|uniref:MaoC family dehydratase n=1 Tax=Nocardioides nitrophenolicus TaxID=60489 RepID=UPI00195A8873|nr:MaoC family dehydratase [Nocardioides nitrophenolicus]MBM7517495.1 acyl dehydratase [Nocardioides nitrophenolicus]